MSTYCELMRQNGRGGRNSSLCGKRTYECGTAVLCFRELRSFASIDMVVVVAVVRVAAQVLAAGKVIASAGWLEVDPFGALILVLVAGVGLLASLYSLGYMPRTTHNPSILHHYYGNFNLFIFSMVMVPVLVSPSVEWLAVEFTTLLSVLLVGFESNREALEAAWKYAILTLTGAAIALFGFLLLFWAMHKGGGSVYTWTALAAVAAKMPPAISKTAFLMVLVGFGAKVGLVPLHTGFRMLTAKRLLRYVRCSRVSKPQPFCT